MRRLTLRSERLSDLTSDELALVNAAALITEGCTTAVLTVDVQRCLALSTQLFTGTTTTG